jgi:hypothetical protein
MRDSKYHHTIYLYWYVNVSLGLALIEKKVVINELSMIRKDLLNDNG